MKSGGVMTTYALSTALAALTINYPGGTSLYLNGDGTFSTIPTATSGTYTPTRSAEANLDSNVTPSSAQYCRCGNVVTVTGRVTVDPTLTATATSFELSLPVSSNIGAVEDLSGVAFCPTIAGMGAGISGSVANNTAVFTWVSSDVASQTFCYTYSYEVI